MVYSIPSGSGHRVFDVLVASDRALRPGGTEYRPDSRVPDWDDDLSVIARFLSVFSQIHVFGG